MQRIATSVELEVVLREPLALLYKHSERCPISAMSLHEMAHIGTAYPDLPVYLLDVHDGRPLARDVAERLGVRHESPQVILLRAGEALWHASHYGVQAHAVSRALGRAANGG